MLDTVRIAIPQDSYRILKPDMFKPNAEFAKLYSHIFVKFETTGQKKRKLSTDQYIPKAWITPRRLKNEPELIRDLVVEFSVPKLIYGNNLEHPKPEDLDFACSFLETKLQEKGIELLDDMQNAEVRQFHVGKNIVLPEGEFSDLIIQDLSKIQLTHQMDLDYKEFLQGPSKMLQLYAQTHAWVVYNKVAELIADTATTKKIRKEILGKQIIRVEVRLQQKPKMISVLRDLGIIATNQPKVLLQDVFNQDVWDRLLDYYWQKYIMANNRMLYAHGITYLDLIQAIHEQFSRMTGPKVEQLAMLYLMARKNGVAATRTSLELSFGKNHWAKVWPDLKKLNDLTVLNSYYSWFTFLDQQLRLTIDKN